MHKFHTKTDHHSKTDRSYYKIYHDQSYYETYKTDYHDYKTDHRYFKTDLSDLW
jgi:hypothetical protein